MNRVFLCCIALLLATVVVATGDDGIRARPVVRISNNQVIGFDRMVDELRGARLIFVGEVHDNHEHHLAQLAVIQALHDSGAKLAIGLEMFNADAQGDLDAWLSGKVDVDSFIKRYNLQWNMPWPLYRDIFIYARDEHIPLIGLNMPREIIRKVALEGFAALTREELKRLPPGITCSVSPAYMAFVRKAYRMGHAGNDKSFAHFCEAQMLWNKSLGRNLQGFMAQNPDKVVVVLTGLGHAMKMGTPDEVSRDTGFSYKVLLPDLPGLERQSVTGEDADYLLLFDHAGSR